jgi:hypothetical protein
MLKKKWSLGSKRKILKLKGIKLSKGKTFQQICKIHVVFSLFLFLYYKCKFYYIKLASNYILKFDQIFDL